MLQKSPYRKAELKLRELNQKVRIHKFKTLLIVLAVAVVVVLAVYGILTWHGSRSFQDYVVRSRIERADEPGTRYVEFAGNILQYNIDGAFYLDRSNRMIWNQTYELREPEVDICENYLAIYDKGGKEVFILNDKGSVGQITTDRPISRVQVASQGTIAILMVAEGTGYIHLFDREGSFLAEGELHTKNSGYPLDIAISRDATKLAVSMVDITDGEVKSTIAFYNFEGFGQNQIDNMVGSFSYEDMVIPRIAFLGEDILIAFGDRKLVLYNARRTPSMIKEIDLDKEVQSIFFNEEYAGLVLQNDSGENPHRMKIYDRRGSELQQIDFSMNYDEVGFLENDEICVRSNLECAIFTLGGAQRFHANFDRSLQTILSDGFGRRYLFVFDDAIEKVRLR